MITTLIEYLTKIETLIIPDSDLSSTTLPWFRGQGDSSWNLTPSIYRGDWDASRERELHRDFTLRALMEIDHKPTMYVGWMFVMQHHGLPTRLLDWTESSVAALYFAVENYSNAADAAVWVIHPWNLNELPTSFGQRSVPHLNEDIEADYLFPKNTIPIPRIAKDLPMALRPAHTTRRIVAQRGHFTIHGQSRKGLDEIPTVSARLLTKLEIAGTSKLRILQDLYKVGISRFTLFPDLDGLSIELRIRYSKNFMR